MLLNHPSMVVSRERERMRATETLMATPSSVGARVPVTPSSVGARVPVTPSSVGARVPVILSQQVGGVDSEHWSGGM